MKKKIVMLLLTLAMSATALTGCGSKDVAPEKTTPSSSVEVSVDASVDTSSEAEPESSEVESSEVSVDKKEDAVTTANSIFETYKVEYEGTEFEALKWDVKWDASEVSDDIVLDNVVESVKDYLKNFVSRDEYCMSSYLAAPIEDKTEYILIDKVAEKDGYGIMDSMFTGAIIEKDNYTYYQDDEGWKKYPNSENSSDDFSGDITLTEGYADEDASYTLEKNAAIDGKDYIVLATNVDGVHTRVIVTPDTKTPVAMYQATDNEEIIITFDEHVVLPNIESAVEVTEDDYSAYMMKKLFGAFSSVDWSDDDSEGDSDWTFTPGNEIDDNNSWDWDE